MFCFRIFYQDQQSEFCSEDEGDRVIKRLEQESENWSNLFSRLNKSLIVNDCQTTLAVLQQQQVRRDAECICDEDIMKSLDRYVLDKTKSGKSTSRNILNGLASRMVANTFGEICPCNCKKGM